MDRAELKAQALLEKISYLENQNADLRVELTVALQELQQAKEAVSHMEADLASSKAAEAVESDVEAQAEES